jgi:hypothetical protein
MTRKPSLASCMRAGCQVGEHRNTLTHVANFSWCSHQPWPVAVPFLSSLDVVALSSVVVSPSPHEQCSSIASPYCRPHCGALVCSSPVSRQSAPDSGCCCLPVVAVVLVVCCCLPFLTLSLLSLLSEEVSTAHPP